MEGTIKDDMKSVTVKGTRYKIIYIEEMEHLGLCDISKKKIYINKCMNESETQICLLHEIGHAIFSECGINQAVSNEIEEVIVENFSNIIYNLFFRRPKKNKRK